MKRSIILLAAIVFAASLHAQTKKVKTKQVKKDSTVKMAAPASTEKMYHFSFDLPTSGVNRLGEVIQYTVNILDDTGEPANKVKLCKNVFLELANILGKQVAAQNIDTTKKKDVPKIDTIKNKVILKSDTTKKVTH